MRRAIGRTWQLAAALPLLAAGLPACRPGDFDGLSGGGSHEEVDPSQLPDAGPLLDAGIDSSVEPTQSDSAAPQMASDAQGPNPGFDAAAPEDAGKADAGSMDAGLLDAASGLDAGNDARADTARDAAAMDSTLVDSAPPPVDAGPTTVQLPILADRDDALWLSPNGVLEEKLHFGPNDGAAGYTIEVGTDSEMCRLGLRFALPFGNGAQVISANLAIRRVGPASNADSTSTMAVRVFESDSVPPFDAAHTHGTPSQHDPDGVWLGQAVTGYAVGMTDAWNQSPNLAALVQHVIDRSGFRAGNYIGFVLSPDVMPGMQYAQFRDSFAGEDPAVLTVTYQP